MQLYVLVRRFVVSGCSTKQMHVLNSVLVDYIRGYR